MVLIETNSSPSGQKSLPFDGDNDEQGGYRALLERAFLPALKRRGLPSGGLAVVYDKNEMEASGYAATLADLVGEPVWLSPMRDDGDAPSKVDANGVLHVRCGKGDWHPIRGAMRYVTQKPWNRLPPVMKTLLLNPTVVCLAGGRNKAVAAKAYDLHNSALQGSGLKIRVPETIWDVTKEQVPFWVERMGGVAVVKVPYANAGQGVYTITSARELAAFMESESVYERYIVQALIGNSSWSSRTDAGRLFHVGTVPNKRKEIFVADIRMMVGASPEGFFPVAIYSRRAREPLSESLDADVSSWGMLGTNLSIALGDGRFVTEPERLMLMAERDFNRLGIGIDDLIEGYIQTILSVTAIDEMASRLVNAKGRFRRKWFSTLNPDPALVAEVCT